MRKNRLLTFAVIGLVVLAAATTVMWFVLPESERAADRYIGQSGVAETVAPYWFVDSVPTLDIAGENEAGELMFVYPSGATQLPNGYTLVGDMYANDLKLFDSDGRLVRTIGRSGAGPFEFRAVSELRRCMGDSVFVYDRLQDRITVIDPVGRPARSFVLTGASRSWSAMTFDCSAGGLIASWRFPVTNARMMMDGSPGTILESVLYLVNPEGVITDSIVDIPVYETRPFGRVVQSAIGDGVVAIGTSDSSALDLYSTDGDYLSTVLLLGSIREPTASQYDAHIEQLVAPFPGADMRAQWRRELRKVPLPEQAPPYSDVIADSEGLFWVVLSLPGDSLTYLRAVNREGSIVVDVVLDSELSVFEIGSDYILGRYDDSEGQVHVAKYRLHRGD